MRHFQPLIYENIADPAEWRQHEEGQFYFLAIVPGVHEFRNAHQEQIDGMKITKPGDPKSRFEWADIVSAPAQAFAHISKMTPGELHPSHKKIEQGNVFEFTAGHIYRAPFIDSAKYSKRPPAARKIGMFIKTIKIKTPEYNGETGKYTGRQTPTTTLTGSSCGSTGWTFQTAIRRARRFLADNREAALIEYGEFYANGGTGQTALEL